MFFIFFFNDTATTEIYTLSLHDALPISDGGHFAGEIVPLARRDEAGVETGELVEHDEGIRRGTTLETLAALPRSEEHTSELQSRQYLVCRLLLEKKKIKNQLHMIIK